MKTKRECLIEEKKQATVIKNMEEQVKLLSSAIEQSTEAIAVSDLEGNLLFINKAFAVMHGYTPEELIGKHLSIFHTPDQLPTVEAAVKQVLETGEFSGEIWHIRRDGTIFPTLMHNSILKNEKAVPISLIGTARDITELKKAEEELRMSEETTRVLLNATTDAILLLDPNGVIITLNEAAGKNAGKSVDELIGTRGYDIMPPNLAKFLEAQNDEVVRTGKPLRFEKEIFGRFTDNSLYPIFDEQRKIERIAVFSHDITNRKKAEQKLKESEELYKALVRTSPDAIIVSDLKGAVIDISQRALELSGFESTEDLIGKSALDFIAPEDHEKALKNFQKTFKNGILENAEYKFLKKDGSYYIGELNASLIKDIYGKPKSFITTIRDITERKKEEQDRKVAEQKLIKSEKEMSIILGNIPELIVFQDLDYNIIRTNKVAGDSVSTPPEELVGRKCFNVWYNKNLPCKNCPLDNTKKTKQSTVGEKKGSSGNIYKIGTYPVFDEFNNMTGIIEVAQDITEQKFAEQKLKESEEKYHEAYERANFYKDLFTHDINNILNNIQSSIDLQSFFKNKPEKLKEFNDIIRGQVVRATKLVLNVRKLSQLEDIQGSLQRTEISKVLKEAIDFLNKSTQGRKVNIQFDISDKNLFVRANDLLLDVFENILINTATHNKNPIIEILIRISKKQKEGKFFLKLEFMDNGYGIPDIQKSFIFKSGNNNSKTTKGMGFGLTLVKKIVDSYKGEIWVEDKVKGDHTKGSNFVLLIPLVE